METTAITIKEPVLRELAEASALAGITVAGHENGFAVVARIGDASERVLANSRGKIRLFASLDTAGAFVRDVGLPRFQVDMNGYEKGRLRKARPDRAEALRGTRTKLHQQALFSGELARGDNGREK